MRSRLLALLLVLLCGCGGGGAGGGDGGDGGAAPAGTHIVFPPAGAVVTEPMLTVVGETRLGEPVAAATVNGVTAVSQDGFRSWRAEVPLGSGSSEIVVRTETTSGRIEARAAAAAVFNTGMLRSDEQTDLAYDATTDTIYLVDGNGGRVLAVAAGDASARVVSGPARGTGPGLGNPTQIALDPLSGRAWLVDGSSDIVEIGLATGDRRTLSSPSVGGGVPVTSISDVVYDDRGDRLLAAGRFGAAGDVRVIAVSPVTGRRTPIARTDGLGPALAPTQSLALDHIRNQLYSLDTQSRILFRIDVPTGSRLPLSGGGFGSGPPLSGVLSIDVAAGPNRALAADFAEGALFSIDLVTGERRLDAGPARGEGTRLGRVTDLVVDEDRDRVLAMTSDTVLSVDLASGDRALVLGQRRGAGTALAVPGTIARDAATGKVYVHDRMTNALVEIDPAHGDRRVVVDGAAAAEPFLIDGPLAFDSRRGEVLLVATALGGGSQPTRGLFSLDVTSGERSLVSELPTENQLRVRALGYDAVRDQAVGVYAEGTVVAVPRPSGAPVVLSSFEMTGPFPEDARAIAVDTARGRAFVLARDEVFAVDLLGGARSLVTGTEVGSGPPLGAAQSLDIDPSRGRLFVVTRDPDALMEVGLLDGSRRVLIDASMAPELRDGEQLTIDRAAGIATLTVSGRTAAVELVELTSGDRALLSR